MLVSKEAFSVILGLFQSGWQIMSSFVCRKACIMTQFAHHGNFF